MAKRKGLGRGLDALLGGEVSSAVLDGAGEETLRNLPVDTIRRGPFQPRLDMDPVALEELTSSIRAQGVVQPIVVRPSADRSHYELIAGERRWRAAQAAGLGEIPAVIREADDETVLAMSLIENIQREDLNPIEEAKALRRLTEEFDLTHQAAADSVGRSRAAVTNLLRLLELNDEVAQLLARGEIEMGHARALLGLAGPAQGQAARQVVAKGLSVRETERLVRRLKSEGETKAPPRSRPDPDIGRLQEELSERLGAAVRIQPGSRGRGRLVIDYVSLDQLDGILERIR